MIINSKKRVVVINTSPYVGGAEISLKFFLSRIDKQYEIFLITGINDFFDDINSSKHLKVISIHEKVSVFYFIYRIFINFFSCIASVVFFRPSVIYFNSIKSFYNFFYISFFYTKIILHIRDNMSKQKLSHLLISFFIDSIICNSKYVYNQLSFKNKSKAVVVYNGVDFQEFKSEKASKLNDIKKIACIGQITPWKNQIDFVKAAKLIYDKNSKTRFFIIGSVLNIKDDLYKKKILDEIDSLGLKKIIKFTGFVSDMQKMISEIDVLIHPALKEPFGRVLIEAMSMKKPVVSYYSGGLIEIIKHNETGFLVECLNYKQLAIHTLKLIGDDQLTTEFGKKGRKRVIEKFGLETHIKKMKVLLFN